MACKTFSNFFFLTCPFCFFLQNRKYSIYYRTGGISSMSNLWLQRLYSWWVWKPGFLMWIVVIFPSSNSKLCPQILKLDIVSNEHLEIVAQWWHWVSLATLASSSSKAEFILCSLLPAIYFKSSWCLDLCPSSLDSNMFCLNINTAVFSYLSLNV